MSRRHALRYRLAAYRARIRPGTTAELASLVLRMSDEIDTRERMLDAALGSPGRGTDVADFDQVRIAAGRPPRDKPADVAAPDRHASGIGPVTEPPKVSATGIVQ
jgi:hypothetical protein